MAQTTGTIVWQDQFLEGLGNGVFNLSSDTLILILLDTGHVPDVVNDGILSDVVADESSNYSRVTLTNVTWVLASNEMTLNFDDPSVAASGGDTIAKYFYIFDDTPTSPVDPLICHGLMDNTTASVTISDGASRTMGIPASGLGVLRKA